MPYRTMCCVLDEMRKCFKTRNFSYLDALIEEIQVMGNKMEAGLEERRTEVWKLKKKIESLGGDKAPRNSYSWDDEEED